jgi:hypothetical protein
MLVQRDQHNTECTARECQKLATAYFLGKLANIASAVTCPQYRIQRAGCTRLIKSSYVTDGRRSSPPEVALLASQLEDTYR